MYNQKIKKSTPSSNRKLKCTIVLLLLIISKISFAQSLVDRDYVNLLSRKLNDVREMPQWIKSPVAVYDASQGGVTSKCFWTKDRNELLKAKDALIEALKSPKTGISGKILEDFSFTYFFPDSFTGSIFEAKPTPYKNQKKVILDRICVQFYPDQKETNNKIRSQSLRSLSHLDRAMGLITILEALEKNGEKYKNEMIAVSKEIEKYIQLVKSESTESTEVRDIFLQNLPNRIESNHGLQSELAYSNLLSSLNVQRDFFIPDHRVGEFLARLSEIHKDLLSLSDEQRVIWYRNLLWMPQVGKGETHIEFQVTSKKELCENYFTFALPIYVHQLNQKYNNEVSSNSNFKTPTIVDSGEMVIGINDFINQVIPSLKSQCQYVQSIKFLESELQKLMQTDFNNYFQKLKNPQSILELEKRLSGSNLRLPERPLLEFYTAPHDDSQGNVLKFEDYKLTRSGDLRFIPINDLDELPIILSRIGFFDYSKSSYVCGFFMEPLLNGFSLATYGTQINYFGGCAKDALTQGKGSNSSIFNLRSISILNHHQLNLSSVGSNNYNYSLSTDGGIRVTFTNYTNLLKDLDRYRGHSRARNLNIYLISHIVIPHSASVGNVLKY